MDIGELVYESLIGELIVPLRNVPNAFEEGSVCERNYQEMLDAYARLRDRLGVVDEDADVEIIIDSLLAIQRELCLKIFNLGNILGSSDPSRAESLTRRPSNASAPVTREKSAFSG